MQLQITTYQILAGAFINATAVIISALLATTVSPWTQNKRDNRRWEREKLYELHTEAHISLTNLMRAITTSDVEYKTSAMFYAATGALERLKLAYTGEQAEIIFSIDQTIRSFYSGNIIQKSNLDELEKLRQQLLVLAQNDLRLRDLFKQ